MRRINLIPAQSREQRRIRRRVRLWAFALAGSAGVLVLACSILRARIPTAGTTDRELAQSTAQLGELNATLAARTRLAADLENNRSTLALLKGQPDWSMLLEILASQTDDETVLREIRITPAAAPIAGPAGAAATIPAPGQLHLPARFRLELRGLCKSPEGVSRFVSRMEKVGIMSDVKLVRAGREPFLSGAATSFELQCILGERPGGK